MEVLEERTLLAGGVLDAGFGVNGIVQTSMQLDPTSQIVESNDVQSTVSAPITNSMAVDTNGNILVAGLADGSGGFTLARFNAAGSLDTSFNSSAATSGFAKATFGTQDHANAVVVQPNGQYVVVGSTNTNEFAIARFNADGTLDTSFAHNGEQIVGWQTNDTYLVPQSASANAVAIAPNGQIEVAGEVTYELGTTGILVNEVAVASLDPDGTMNPDFNGEGNLVFNIGATLSGDGNNYSTDDTITAVAVQPNGQILLGGYANWRYDNVGMDEADHMILARLNADGTLDHSFNHGITVDSFTQTPFKDGGAVPWADRAYDMALESSGSILLAGLTQADADGLSSGNTGQYNFGVARFTSSGVLDTTFNATGEEITDLSPNFNADNQDLAYSIALQSDGNIVVAGSTIARAPGQTGGTDTNFAMIRITSAGTLDPNFGTDGKVITDINNGSDDVAADVEFLPNGNLLVGGNSNSNFVMAHYTGLESLQFSSPNYTVQENGGTATITVVRTGGSDGTVAVSYATSDGTAVAGTDYTTTTGTLTFGSGVTSQTFTVPIIDPGIYAPTNSSLTLTLSSPQDSSALGSPSTATLTIIETDPPSAFQFSAATYSALENSQQAVITVTRTDPQNGPATVTVGATPGTPSSGPQFTVTPATLSFATGQSSATFDVTLIDDDFFQSPNETVSLSLSDPTGPAILGTQSTTVLTIITTDSLGTLQFSAASYTALENSLTASIVVTRTNGTEQSVSVDVGAASDTPNSGPEFIAKPTTLTFGPGDTSETYYVTLLDDGVYAYPNETLLLALTNPTDGATLGTQSLTELTIINTDGVGTVQFGQATYNAPENSGSASIVVTRTGGSNGVVTVDYAAAVGTPTSGSEFTFTPGTLTFPPGVTSQIISVPLTDDHVYVSPNETLTLVLGNATGGATLGTPSTTVLTVQNTAQPGVFEFSPTAQTVADNGGVATFTVERTGGSDGTVSVVVDTTLFTPNSGPMFQITPTTLSFGPGVISQIVSIPISVVTNFQLTPETASISFFNPAGGATIGTDNTAVLTIVPTGGTPIEEFLAQVYMDLLGRTVDSAGLEAWSAVLNAGGTRQQVVADIESSTEYRNDAVNGLYEKYLHRSADPAGLAAFTSFLGSGGTDEQVAAMLVASPEYYQLRGGGTSDGFLTALYGDALGRAVDPTGRAAFDQLLAAGTSRNQVAMDILTSLEYKQDLVASIYQNYLRRAADSAGLNYFANLLGSQVQGPQPIFAGNPVTQGPPVQDETIIAMIMGSQEYLNRLTS